MVLATHFGAMTAIPSPGEGAQMLAIARSPLPEREIWVWEAPAAATPLELADAALRVVQQALSLPSPPALRLVTRDAQPVGEDPIAADQAVLLGLGRVIAIEHPELDCRLADLPPRAPVTLAETLPADASEAAWRDGVWQVPRLVRAELPSEPAFATGGIHLVTGGLGGLGPLLAAWLLERGATGVVLMARTARPELTLPPCVTAALGDVAEPRDVRRVLDAIGSELRGTSILPARSATPPSSV